MGRKKDPASAVVEFFETTALETAETVLNICKGIVTRRAGRPQAPRLKRAVRGREEAAIQEKAAS
jgi:hypothetical protein